MNLSELGLRLRARRESLGLSQAAVARAAACAPQFISFVERQNPVGNPNTDLLLRLLDALDLDMKLEPRHAPSVADELVAAVEGLEPEDVTRLTNIARAFAQLGPRARETLTAAIVGAAEDAAADKVRRS